MVSDIKAAYDVAAEVYRKRYDGIPPRVEDVDRALSFVTIDNPTVIEIGCAYGREAGCILARTKWYVGFDICSAYIDMARAEHPTGTFLVRDVMEYPFPVGIDVVLAFASLLHNPKEDVAVVLERVVAALNPGGVVFLSLKRRAQYETTVETDDVVSRRFYYYTRQTILDCAPEELVEVFYEEQSRSEEWFTMILQKQ